MLEPGARAMVDDDEWDWICERLVGDHDHLVIGTSLPLLLGQGMHYLEAWNEAVCDGAWGAWRRASARRSAGRSTSSTGPRSASRSSG